MMHRYLLYRMANGHFLLFLLGLLVVVGIVLLIVYLTSRKYKTPANQAAGAGAAEYEERRMMLDGARGDNHANAEIVLLKERYARGELTTAAFVEARNKLLGIG